MKLLKNIAITEVFTAGTIEQTGISGHYDDIFINYVNGSSAEARKLTPKAKILIAHMAHEC